MQVLPQVLAEQEPVVTRLVLPAVPVVQLLELAAPVQVLQAELVEQEQPVVLVQLVAVVSLVLQAELVAQVLPQVVPVVPMQAELQVEQEQPVAASLVPVGPELQAEQEQLVAASPVLVPLAVLVAAVCRPTARASASRQAVFS